jgi:hypothetical protein
MEFGKADIIMRNMRSATIKKDIETLRVLKTIYDGLDLQCSCGELWKISPSESKYEGEVVLRCACGQRFFNAQAHFSDTEFNMMGIWDGD